MIAKLSLTETGSFQGLLKVAGLGGCLSSFQARNRKGGEPKSGRRGRLGNLTQGTRCPPPAPGLFCSRAPRVPQRGIWRMKAKLRLRALSGKRFSVHAKGNATGPRRDGAALPADPPARICREASFAKPTSAVADIFTSLDDGVG